MPGIRRDSLLDSASAGCVQTLASAAARATAGGMVGVAAGFLPLPGQRQARKLPHMTENTPKCPHAGTAEASAKPTGRGRVSAEGKGAAPRAPSAKLLTERPGLLNLVRLSRTNILEVIPARLLEKPILSGKMVRRFHLVAGPKGMERILKSNIDNYPKSPEAKGILDKVLKRGLFVIDGAEWRWQRRATAPVFAPRNITALGPWMTKAAADSAKRLEGREGAVNVSDEMMRAAFDVIVSVTFQGGDGESAVPLDVINDAIEQYLGETGKVSLLDYLGLPRWVPRPGRVRTHPTLRALQKGADDAIAERRRNPQEGNPALIDMMIAAEDPKTGRKMNDAELRDNLITMLIAGHETTASALSWSLYLLALDPASQARASAEAREVLGDRAATVEDVPKLDFIRQVLFEAMRLYPPIPFHVRTAQAEDVVCGHAVKAGDTMLLPFYALHRHKQLWKRPNAFVPERFEDMSKIDKFAYIPFSAGPRICIGADFATQESIIILASLLARYRFERVEGKDPTPELILTLRPRGGVWLTVTPHEGATT